MISPLQLAVVSLMVLFVAGCGPKSATTSGTKAAAAAGGVIVVVTDPYDDSKIMLSPKQAQWFVNDVSGPGRRSMISKYPAAAIASFEYGGKEYLMHGNAVIHVQDDGTEFLWTGPYLQALISEGAFIRESITRVEAKADLKDVKMDAPGAYPGGGPAPLVGDDK